MGPNFTDTVKRRIVELHDLQYGVTRIQRKLLEEGYSASQTGIYNVLKKWKIEKNYLPKTKTFQRACWSNE